MLGQHLNWWYGHRVLQEDQQKILQSAIGVASGKRLQKTIEAMAQSKEWIFP